ncbi:MAG: oligosaccharide flippase family protein [Aquificaceae bacterium]
MSLAYLYANLVGYIFHFLVSRKLGPQGYGEFMVLYSLMISMGNAVGFLGVPAVKLFVDSKLSYEVLRYMRVLSLLIGLLTFAVCVFLSPFLTSFLKVSYVFYFWVIACVWIFQPLLIVERAYLQSFERFSVLSLSVVLEQTTRLIAVFIFLQSGLYVTGALLSSLMAMFTASAFVLWMNGNIKGEFKKIPLRGLLRTALYYSPSTPLMYADDLFIRRTFDPHTAGLYASVSLLGKVFLWLVLTLMGTLFPRMVHFKNEGKGLKPLVIKMILVILSLFLLAQAGFILVGKPLFLLLFSEKFLEAYSFLPLYLLSILPLSFVMVAIGVFTALGQMLTVLYIHLAIYYLGFSVLTFESIHTYMLYIFSINFVFTIIYFFQILLRKYSSGHQT